MKNFSPVLTPLALHYFFFLSVAEVFLLHNSRKFGSSECLTISSWKNRQNVHLTFLLKFSAIDPKRRESSFKSNTVREYTKVGERIRIACFCGGSTSAAKTCHFKTNDRHLTGCISKFHYMAFSSLHHKLPSTETVRLAETPLKLSFSKKQILNNTVRPFRVLMAASQAQEAKLWGGRFEEAVTPAVEKFGQSVSYDRKLYKFDLQGSRAHAKMLAKQVMPL